MIHPDTELRAVDPRVGYGVVATRTIPKGTITWVRDSLDQALSPARMAELPELLRARFDRYSYLAGSGQYVLCWDHGRFVNHSCAPSCMAPGFDFEIAIRDIAPGEELTGDYATYNQSEVFDCLCGSNACRRRVAREDRVERLEEWDRLVADAFVLLKRVDQPLWPLVVEKAEVERALADRSRIPSCRLHFFQFDEAFGR